MQRRVSPTQKALDNLIYQPTARTRSKRKPIPAASEIITFDYCYTLLRAKWDRMRRTR
ncbi:NinE family protein [Erwinia phyllosphaerae]|uniref:NinE family protein n=1 Tax=Erwinia phyllosphaerae TaxID=2853256 RepID=UPI001FEFB59D|nr:NinE family protein [Erwinia phyllosphaerae]MBV4365894.1 NinE family protein [Erwinia phyllosphaerae]